MDVAKGLLELAMPSPVRINGLGTAAPMANRERYARFTASMHAVYSAMEQNLDDSPSPSNAAVWRPFGSDLRRAPSLQADLDEACALTNLAPPTLSPATREYVAAIEAAARADADDDDLSMPPDMEEFLSDLLKGARDEGDPSS